jgi:SNF2 family DNA or RNA helicase
MITNGPARIFTQESIESWFEKLSDCNWESQFSHPTLIEGRDLYKKGILSGIDVSEDQVIFIRKINREESYSVIEWNDRKKIDFRTSIDNESEGQAIAVAGIYELEELISEIHQDDPMLSRTIEEEITKETVNHEQEEEKIPVELYSHILLISLQVSKRNGLVASPFWVNDLGQRTSPYSPDKSEEIKADRSELMRFVREATDHEFKFEKETGSFHLQDWNLVAGFASEALRNWDDHFKLEFSDDAALLKKGNRSLQWELEAKNRDSLTMSLSESFLLDGKKLKESHFNLFRKIGKNHTFLRGHGLVKLEENQIEDFEWWKQNRTDPITGKWPRYMLFSLFARKYLKTNQDGELAKWQGKIRDLEKNKEETQIKFLRPYQRTGVSRIKLLHQLGCHTLLADEMGLGKTVQALAVLHSTEKSKLPDLVVCPASVVPVWIKEAKTHFPNLQTAVLSQGQNFLNSSIQPSLWVASYTQLRRHRQLLEQVEFRHAVLDEAQMIKNPKAKGTQACLSIRSTYRMALSGTPIENSALDLWTIFRFLMPGLLGSRKDLEKSLSADSLKIHSILQRQVAPFVLRRLKKDVAKELPPKIEAELPCRLNQEQLNTYRKLAEEGILRHGTDLKEAIKHSPTHLFSLLTRLRQTCCDLSLLPGFPKGGPVGIKSEILLQKIHDLKSSNSKAIVFSQFTSYLNILENDLRKEFTDIKLLKLTGATRDRAKPVDEFQNTPKPAIMLASLKAAGLGITLTAADYVFIMDPWWNPAIEEQAIDRAHRIGREKPTFIYRLIAQGTIEERVRQLQRDKKETFKQIIGDMDKPTQLSKHFSDLKDLIKYQEIS